MNRTVLVTGASRGIGRAIASAFAAEGDRLIITCSRSEQELLNFKKELEETFHTEVLASVGDISSFEYVEQLFEQITERFGGVDVLINNAGIVNTDDFDKLTLSNWNRVIAVDLTAVFLTSQVLFRHMEQIGGGRIVNVASIAGKVGGGYLGTAAYAAAKAGVISLTKSTAKAGSSKNIYCNSLCPAYTKTPLVTILTGEKEQKVLDAMSLHRAATPEEVANSVLFLASDAASFVQGENLNCDGGMLMNG